MAKSKSKSWKKALKQRKWGEHKHCQVCGKAIPLGQDFCSDQCRDKYFEVEEKKNKKGKWQIGMIFVVMIVMMVILPMMG